MTRKTQGKLLTTLLLGLLYATPTQAQTAPYVLTTYDITTLDARPGEIIVTPNFLTIIELEDQVEQVATGRADLIQIEVEENRILVQPTLSAGRTDLIVTVQGRTVLFVVRIDSNSQNPRRYLVGTPPPRPPVTRTIAPATARPVEQRAPAEAEPPFSFYINVLNAPSGELVIQYALNNTGANPIANDQNRLRLVEAGRTVPYTLNRVATGGTINRIFPGRAEYGTILIENPPPTAITLEWPIIEIGPGYEYLISRTINRGVSLETPPAR
jgi:hypothetical protein